MVGHHIKIHFCVPPKLFLNKYRDCTHIGNENKQVITQDYLVLIPKLLLK